MYIVYISVLCKGKSVVFSFAPLPQIFWTLFHEKMLKTRPHPCYCNSFLLCANLHLNPLIYKLCIWNFNNLSATNSLHELLVINAVHMNSDGNNRWKWWMMGSEAAYQYVPRRNRSTLHTGTRSRNSSRAVPPSWCNADPPAPSRTQNSKSASYASDGPLPRCTHLQRWSKNKDIRKSIIYWKSIEIKPQLGYYCVLNDRTKTACPPTPYHFFLCSLALLDHSLSPVRVGG